MARKIAAATRPLSQRQAAEIDDRLAEVDATLPPSRLLRVVEAMVLAADTDADAAREAAMKQRFVTINQATEHGTKGLYAKLDVADAIRLDAEVDRLARILAARGDESTLDVRRSTALGWLANPAAALRLIAETEPEGLATDLATTLSSVDPDLLRPRVELVVHVTESDFTRDADGVARFEAGGRSGPITLDHAREILGHAHVTIRPVIDLVHQLPADAYEFTGTLREAAFLATPVDCFPYAVSTSRKMQLDHTTPYDDTGPPGQTRLDNAGPLTQRHHRIATHGRWRKKQPRQGFYAWCTPHRRYRITSHTGTHALPPGPGRGLFDGTRAEQRFITNLLPPAHRRWLASRGTDVLVVPEQVVGVDHGLDPAEPGQCARPVRAAPAHLVRQRAHIPRYLTLATTFRALAAKRPPSRPFGYGPKGRCTPLNWVVDTW